VDIEVSGAENISVM